MFKSIFGTFYKQYNSGEFDSKFLSRLFKQSKILSDINKSILYFNMPFDTIVKEKRMPQ